jgi:hypothetical protein
MKKIGGRIYLHKSACSLLDSNLYYCASKAKEVCEHIIGSFNWNCLRIKPDGLGGAFEVAFQYSPDFNEADEPEVVQTIPVIFNDVMDMWEVSDIRVHKDTIWHHKWMWVKPDYKGFDYEASKARSALWKPHVKKSELTKIGNKVYWESIKGRWENGH